MPTISTVQTLYIPAQVFIHSTLSPNKNHPEGCKANYLGDLPQHLKCPGAVAGVPNCQVNARVCSVYLGT